MATLYSYATSSGAASNWNNNAPTDNFAYQFAATATGVPGSMVINVRGTFGAGACVFDFYIRDQRTISGATTYATATAITLVPGGNNVTFSGGSSITSGNTYYLWQARTSASTDYPQFDGNFGGGPNTLYKSTASNADPNTSWLTSFGLYVTITSAAAATGNPAFLINFLR